MYLALILSIILISFSNAGFTQQSSYFDAAQAYNRLVIEKNNGTHTRVEQYKVVGSPFLFGEKLLGNLFAKGESAYNIKLSYDTYNQQVEFYSSANPTTPLIKETGEVDSFSIAENHEVGLTKGLKFYAGKVLSSSEDNNFYQLMYNGDNVSFYKKYKSTLGRVSTNIIQSELRQFDLEFEYAYKMKDGELKRLRTTYFQVSKELKPFIKVGEIVDAQTYSSNPDLALLKIFAALDRK